MFASLTGVDTLCTVASPTVGIVVICATLEVPLRIYVSRAPVELVAYTIVALTLYTFVSPLVLVNLPIFVTASYVNPMVPFESSWVLNSTLVLLPFAKVWDVECRLVTSDVVFVILPSLLNTTTSDDDPAEVVKLKLITLDASLLDTTCAIFQAPVVDSSLIQLEPLYCKFVAQKYWFEELVPILVENDVVLLLAILKLPLVLFGKVITGLPDTFNAVNVPSDVKLELTTPELSVVPVRLSASNPIVILEDPSKLVPFIVLGVLRAEAVAAFPLNSPAMLPPVTLMPLLKLDVPETVSPVNVPNDVKLELTTVEFSTVPVNVPAAAAIVMLAVPLKFTPLIVLVFASAVAVAAFPLVLPLVPDTFPVTFPVTSPTKLP